MAQLIRRCRRGLGGVSVESPLVWVCVWVGEGDWWDQRATRASEVGDGVVDMMPLVSVGCIAQFGIPDWNSK